MKELPKALNHLRFLRAFKSKAVAFFKFSTRRYIRERFEIKIISTLTSGIITTSFTFLEFMNGLESLLELAEPSKHFTLIILCA